MGQSLVKNYLHLIFSTKHRIPIINGSIEERLHSYIGGICRTLECPPIRIGGDVDHVQIVCMLSKKVALMKLMEVVKSSSSNWVKDQGASYQNFYWQDGYAAFSVSESEVDTVVAYIDNQKKHHRKNTFQEELLNFLKVHHITYDERYLWD